MKKCTKCLIEKSLNDFSCLPKSKDGKNTRCKECINKLAKERLVELRKDPSFFEKERNRTKEKYHRLYKKTPKGILGTTYKSNHGIDNYENLNGADKRDVYNKRFPEKENCKLLLGKKFSKTGLQRHHWSYNAEHACDIIHLTVLEHKKLHRYIMYDQEHYMYRRIDTMELLDTKQKHIDYYNSLTDKP